MKIIQLIPGAGENFYCENCLRDANSIRALRAAGHDALACPLYLPPPEALASEIGRTGPVFFGGINVYLQQTFAFFRRTPRWLDRLFDARGLLRWAGRKTNMTSARVLGETTVSMLQGPFGRQGKELARLGEHLAAEKPDAVILSNALLAGLAGACRRAGARVLCRLQDEDFFLDSLPRPYREQAWNELQTRCDEIDLFLAPSEYYRSLMRERLGLDESRVVLLREGVDPPEQPAAPPPTPVIGFLSQFSEGKGLDLLVEAVAILRSRPGLANLRLRAAGGQTAADRTFVSTVRHRIQSLGLTGAVELQDAFDADAKRNFLPNLSVLAVPTRRPEANARYLLEALAAGVPVAAPRCGAQQELVDRTGGGLLFEPGDLKSLVEALQAILTDRAAAGKLARAGRACVERDFQLRDTARRLAELCRLQTQGASA
jgi:glycosyltransferase involved in cell wall biosynthesis